MQYDYPNMQYERYVSSKMQDFMVCANAIIQHVFTKCTIPTCHVICLLPTCICQVHLCNMHMTPCDMHSEMCNMSTCNMNMSNTLCNMHNFYVWNMHISSTLCNMHISYTSVQYAGDSMIMKCRCDFPCPMCIYYVQKTQYIIM